MLMEEKNYLGLSFHSSNTMSFIVFVFKGKNIFNIQLPIIVYVFKFGSNSDIKVATLLYLMQGGKKEKKREQRGKKP